jgi:hypothetical protein
VTGQENPRAIWSCPVSSNRIISERDPVQPIVHARSQAELIEFCREIIHADGKEDTHVAAERIDASVELSGAFVTDWAFVEKLPTVAVSSSAATTCFHTQQLHESLQIEREIDL